MTANKLLFSRTIALPATTYANTAAAVAAMVEVDGLGFRWALVTLNAGVVGTSIDATLQASATSGSGYADITGADFTQVTAAGGGSILVDLQKVARYLLLDPTLVGSCDFGVDIVLFEPADTAYVSATEHDAVVTAG